ncbi:GlsB/YeaQ/YmgE family stress response membrane protein [Alysiella filiformis]|uniref:Uncharacterized membrane protein YeaQ/YmgE, transglycosylase-associated protein family n=1 Tax=Alysiella filiformis DSM 16848 TaxID=1120981 RepID=A0A286EBL1_9NEIS|nr:GlsB/YeaQ/YmgE family stress response membrane protein [Alysiella filiformis]QMT31307.1 GlsB/YeaQ/YmgE family stress response membrane protein [Alysiella filiformis]UBQ55687.1 GlsB/YeaQ/YmgE family stress response membrane protein [Alysiella filiformis DSM 16848]SOD68325.1 Uncharacterized membrane protein YeaQ/YmgE, transglycosylase-associated protein family [Alysiella filiformis DSM 16848]
MIWSIVIGLIVGLLARFLKPGKDAMGWIATIFLGIAGSFGAGVVGRGMGWYAPDETAGFIASVIMAVILLTIYNKMKK